MKELKQIDKEIFKDYIEKQLKIKGISKERKADLRILRDIYIRDKAKKTVIEKGIVSATTLWRIEKRFYEVFKSGEAYGDLKLNGNKLTDRNKNLIIKALERSPVYAGVYFTAWDARVLKEYIYESFQVQYSERQCQNIINRYFQGGYESMPEESRIYVADFFPVAMKNYEKKLSKSVSYRRSRVVYMALIYDKQVVYAADTFEGGTDSKAMVKALMRSVKEAMAGEKEAFVIFQGKDFSLQDMKEINKEGRIKFICVRTRGAFEEAAGNKLSDMEDIRKNIEVQMKSVDFSYNSRYKEKIAEIIKNS